MSKIIKEAIENTIGGNAYQHDKVNHWTKTVVDNCLGVLTKLQKPYKYIGENLIETSHFSFVNSFQQSQLILFIIVSQFSVAVTCMIMQKNGAGLHTASSCYWNNETDGSCTVCHHMFKSIINMFNVESK